MTVVDEHTDRDTDRQELAELLDLTPKALTDGARLRDDLALDSLAMMRLLAWLESHGVTVDHSGQPGTVGDVLDLAATARRPGLSVHLVDATGPGAGPAATPPRRPAADPLAPVLETPAIWLTPVQPDDVPFLYGLAVHPATSYRWRYRGAPPSVERFAENLWKQVFVQFVARRAADREPVGHLIGFGADAQMLNAHVGAAFLPGYAGTGLAAGAVAMFLRYLFRTFPFRKLYLEVPGFNWPQVKSGEGRLFEVEGVLREHSYYAGRFWDEYLCAVYADRLAEGRAMR
jgi:RimJ/RimL family protein N-acetyltransferase/aryl carrier-like protein